jgi:hypothetical protein
MLFAPPFGLLAHGRAVSKDCLHAQAQVLYPFSLQKSIENSSKTLTFLQNTIYWDLFPLLQQPLAFSGLFAIMCYVNSSRFLSPFGSNPGKGNAL